MRYLAKLENSRIADLEQYTGDIDLLLDNNTLILSVDVDNIKLERLQLIVPDIHSNKKQKHWT